MKTLVRTRPRNFGIKSKPKDESFGFGIWSSNDETKQRKQFFYGNFYGSIGHPISPSLPTGDAGVCMRDHVGRCSKWDRSVCDFYACNHRHILCRDHHFFCTPLVFIFIRLKFELKFVLRFSSFQFVGLTWS